MDSKLDLGRLRLDWLAHFVHLADCGNLTRAARRAGISQPALHTQLGHLADWAGEGLYVRAGRGVVLTPRGREVERLARSLLEGIEQFRASDDGSSPLVVSAGRGTHLYLLAEPLRRWTDGGGVLRLRSEDGDAVVASVLEGRAHLGVAPLLRPQPALKVAPYRTSGVVGVLRRDHPLATCGAVPLAALAEVSLVLPPRGRPLRAAVDRAFAERGLVPTVVVELEGWDLLVLYASLGVGVALVNDYVPLPPGCVAVPVEGLPSVELRKFVLRGPRSSPAARALFEALGPS